MKRLSYFSGSFYPAEASEIQRYIQHFETVSKGHFDLSVWDDRSVLAVVVPHAGHIYSGFTAHLAFRVLQKEAFTTLVVIGPSHHHYFKGISIADLDTYETPLGSIPIEKSLVSKLQKRFALEYIVDAHKEHSTEVQMPFIKYYMPDVTVVELVYGDTAPEQIQPILEYLVNEQGVGLVISTDLSHFYNENEAKYLDAICVDAFKRVDLDRLEEGCEACGILGLKAMLKVSKKEALTTSLLDYRTSADVSQDHESVVGYMSGLFSKERI